MNGNEYETRLHTLEPLVENFRTMLKEHLDCGGYHDIGGHNVPCVKVILDQLNEQAQSEPAMSVGVKSTWRLAV